MDHIMSHGRMEYLRSIKPEGCIFCKESIRDDSLVLFEGNYCYNILNKYPYNSGHILVVPFRHISKLEDMFMEEKLEMIELMDTSIRILKEVMNPEGFNIGMNIGKASGAGVESHIHLHIVPRWAGDTNFATVLGETRVIPEKVEETRDTLLPFFQKNKEA
ncbi:MAG: HIT domain-containing protein [Syntrophobacterales bacterium]|nr:HIT domain-containing protein [Syntrophobacterales bacterium]OPX41265.1 MAG: HIT family hydrolase [Desulfobacteraceae bacterium 4484_190.3]